MAFGLVSSPADTETTGAISFILKLATMIVDRDALTGQLQELVDAIKEYKALRAEIEEREHEVLQREKKAAAQEQALAKRLEAVVEREDAAQALQARVEKQRAEFAELRAQVRKSLAA
jgi:hypothetical protein